jgi:hypothetical protein
VRKQLAVGLASTFLDADAEAEIRRREALLGELRELAQAHAEDANVREWLAKGLFNTLVDAKAEDDLARCEALPGELRALAEDHPDDAFVQEAWRGVAEMMSVED